MTVRDLLDRAEAASSELLELYRGVLRFPTVNTGVMPTGHETPCAEYLRDVLLADGIEARVVETAPGRGNLLARLRGRGGGRSLLWMSHLDVVPPGDESRWTHDPFDPVVVDGWVIARGSNDCKGLVAPEVQALRLLARHRVPLDGDITLVCGADEETGGAYGFGALAETHADWLRADLGINEGGGAPAGLADGRPALLVSAGEKGRYEATLTLTGRSEHASMPWLADNPLIRLAEVVTRLVEYQHEPFLTDIVRGLLRDTLGESLDHPVQLNPTLQRHAAERAGDVSRLRALSRMTWAPTMVRGGAKSNAIPDRATLTVDVRTLPHQDPESVQRLLEAVLGDVPGLTVTLDVTALPSASAWTPELVEVLTRAMAAAGSPDLTVLPSLCSGFTDARLVRPLGTPVVGFAPLPPEVDLDRCGCHNIDEQFPFAAVMHRTRALLALAWTFCRS